jgi:hypothetical protein
VRRAEGIDEALGPDRVGIGERRRVAHVVADRVAAVLAHDALQSRADLVQRLVPAHSLELARLVPAERVQDAVGVVVDLGHSDALRARETGGQRVL